MAFKSMEGLVRKGKLEGKIDGPVYALGAGFASDFGRGTAGMTAGTSGRTFKHWKQITGKIQFHGGYFLPDGSPTQAKQFAPVESGSGKAKTTAWFLQSDIRNAARAANDLRAFLRLPNDSRLPSIEAITQASLALAQSGIGVTKADILLDHKPEEFDLNQAIENSDGRNKDTWSQIQHVIKNIPRDSANQGGYEEFQRRLGRLFLPEGSLGSFGTQMLQNQIPKERTRIYALQKEFDTLAATNTSSLLSLMNNRVQRSDGWVKAKEESIPVVVDSANTEEQHEVLRKYGAQPVSPPQATGNTGTMDFAYSMYGNIVVGDVSDMEISGSYHHGLSRGAIMNKTEIKEAIREGIETGADGEGGEIRDKIYDYWKKYALPDANRAIHSIKKRAASTYKTNKPSAEQMRNPFGRRTGKTFGVTLRDTGKGEKYQPGKNVKGAALRDISTSTNAMLRHMKGTLGHWVKGSSAKTAMGFANHMLGTWQQHAGAFFHNLTVSKDPHLTAELFLQVHDKGPHRYKFKVKAFAEEHVRVNAGYAVLNMLQKAGQITQKQKGRVIYEMKAAQIGRSIKGAGDNIKAGAINKIQSSNVTNSTSSRIIDAAFEFYLPANAEQHIYRNILKAFEDPEKMVVASNSIVQQDFEGYAERQSNKFDWKLHDRQAQFRRDGFYWPHLTNLWSAPYYAVLRKA